MFNNATLKGCIDKFSYINFCDLDNFISPAINPAQLGYLSFQKRTNVLTSIKYAQNNQINAPVIDGFIDNDRLEFGDILLKTELLRAINQKANDLDQILNTRIFRKPMKDHSDSYYFSRLPQDILYKQWTDIVRVPYTAHNRIQYSNYCKSILGL